MHRVKRPAPEADFYGMSRVHSRMTHDNPGDEPKAEINKLAKPARKYQLNHLGGPLGEEFESSK